MSHEWPPSSEIQLHSLIHKVTKNKWWQLINVQKYNLTFRCSPALYWRRPVGSCWLWNYCSSTIIPGYHILLVKSFSQFTLKFTEIVLTNFIKIHVCQLAKLPLFLCCFLLFSLLMFLSVIPWHFPNTSVTGYGILDQTHKSQVSLYTLGVQLVGRRRGGRDTAECI